MALSVRQQVGEKLTVYADAGWADFSSFDVTNIDLSSGTAIKIPRW